MSITIVRKAAIRRHFAVYDLEWVPETLQVRMCGFFDGEAYQCYPSVGEFLDNILVEENHQMWFYAHAGGLADMQFVLEELQTLKKFEVTASFSGSSAVIVKVKKGNLIWNFVDSYWLLRESLASIGKTLGMEKGNSIQGFENFTEAQKKAWYATVDYRILRTYNEQDCRILYCAIEQFENTLIDWGGQLKMTLASTAMELFRRRFLKKNIATVMNINDIARKSYFASRVEVFARDCEDAYYYDINSSFPYAMTQPCPGEFIKSTKRLPDHEDKIYIADCEVEVPEIYLPPLAYRFKDRVFFPYGKWRSWLTSCDVQLLLQSGGKLRRVHKVLHFKPFTDLADYAKTIYQHRKNETDPFRRGVDKLLMNSLYGKFAESPEKTTLHINPNSKTMYRWNENHSEELGLVESLMPGFFLETRNAAVPHMHVPISAHITALARRRLYDYMKPCPDLFYCDTDSLLTSKELPSSNELGDLKLEKEIQEGIFVAPKVYRVDDQVKAKGFSLARDKGEARTQFNRMMAGEKIEIHRMTRLRELYRKGQTRPKEGIMLKGLTGLFAGKTISKRCMYPDGETRPWRVDEIESTLSRDAE